MLVKPLIAHNSLKKTKSITAKIKERLTLFRGDFAKKILTTVADTYYLYNIYNSKQKLAKKVSVLP